MKLRTGIFLLVFLTTAVPLCALALYAVTYSERLYNQDVRRDITASLTNIAAEIRRRLLLERELLQGLSIVPALDSFTPVLKWLAEGKGLHPEFYPRIHNLERFIENFQSIVPSMSDVRVLDVHGNTLIMIKAGKHTNPAEASAGPIPYLETVIDDAAFQQFLQALPPGQFGYALLPQNNRDQEPPEPQSLYDVFLALGEGKRAVGYLVAKVRHDPINRVLHVSPRLHQGKLLIAEIDPSRPDRDGFILYDDVTDLMLNDGLPRPYRLQDRHPDLYRLVQLEFFGDLDIADDATRIYFSELMPYEDQLLSWVLATRIDLKQLGAPFYRIRVSIYTFAVIALLGSLAAARLGASRIAKSVTDLSDKLTAYAKGDRNLQVRFEGPREIQRAGEAFNALIDSLEKSEQERDQAQKALLQQAKLASIGQLAAGVGHEINTPLNNILSLTKLMKCAMAEKQQDLREDVESVRAEALRASKIVKAVLNFSRQTPMKPRRFEVKPWLQEFLTLLNQEALEKQVTLKLEVQDEYTLVADPDLLEQTLVNLLLNALYASPRGSEIRIVVGMKGTDLVITIHDLGPGISEDNLERIFDPFFTTKPAGEGSGLGLAISLSIVERHGGELDLRNRHGGGVTAKVVIPRAEKIEIRHNAETLSASGR